MRRVVALNMLVALATSARADDGDRWNGSTMAVQAGAGVLGGVIGAGVGGLIGVGIGAATTQKSDWGAQLAIAAIGAGIGGTVGIVGGIAFAGDRRGSTGHWWGATIGLVGGLFVLGGLVKATDHLHPPPIAMLAVGTLVLLGCPIVGYQLTADAHAMPIVNLTF